MNTYGISVVERLNGFGFTNIIVKVIKEPYKMTKQPEYNWKEGWVKTSAGWYSVQDGELIHAQDSEQVKYDPDSWVQVEDLTELKIWEYNELKEILLNELKYNLGNKFI